MKNIPTSKLYIGTSRGSVHDSFHNLVQILALNIKNLRPVSRYGSLTVKTIFIHRIEKYPGRETVAGLVIVVRVGALLEEEENVGSRDLQHRVKFSIQSSV